MWIFPMTLLSEMSLHNMTNAPPWPAPRSENLRSGHQAGVTTSLPPVLPNTRQFLTISKVILLLHGGPLAPTAWGAKPKLEESYGNKLELDTSHSKCLACAATSPAPAPQAAEYEMQRITVMPISILDVMWCSLQRGARLSSVIIFKYFKSSQG